MIETLYQDLRYAWRTLLKSPGFTLVALLTLALGIGANSAIFSVINAALLRPLPYPHPEQLVLLYERAVVETGARNPVALGNFLDWQTQNRSFAAMAAVRHNAFNLGGDGRVQPERIGGAICSWSMFSVLGVSPSLGRPFTAEEDKPGAKPVVVISHGLWQRRPRKLLILLRRDCSARTPACRVGTRADARWIAFVASDISVTNISTVK
ncbi:MAG TPA: ABC transporter permease, partial [Bryobacteraceae bacterium]|nr:ABC transporter permease [Bryobacteraceae bacterium]